MVPFKKFQPELARTPAASVDVTPEQLLETLVQRTSRVSLGPELTTDALRRARETLRGLAQAATDVVTAYAAEQSGAAIEDAARVAALGLAEASEKLDEHAADELSSLRQARHKVYLSIMTLRQTRARVDSVHPPLWAALAPSRGARAALASVRAAFIPASSEDEAESAFQRFVVASELDRVRCRSCFGDLSPRMTRRLADLAATLNDGLASGERPSERLTRAERLLDEMLAELGCQPEQRLGDEQMLEALVHELSERRGDGKLHESVSATLRSLRGFDRDLDELALLVEAGACPPWALLLQRATDLLTQNFRENS